MAPPDRLSFPERPARAGRDGLRYDVDGDDRIDFGLFRGEAGLLDVLRYDDDQDATLDGEYRLSDYAGADVPHLMLLVDSPPYRIVSKRYAEGAWRRFHPPQKVVAPLPSLREVTLGAMLHAPPVVGNIERYFDARTGDIENLWVARAFRYRHPWQ